MLFASLITANAGAREQQMLDHFLNELAFAGLIQNRCPTLKIDEEKLNALGTINRVKQEDVMPHGKYFNRFAKQVDKYSAMVNGWSQEFACIAGDMAFGPQGTDHKDFMVPKR